jgi:hypothetical protein
VSASVNFTLSAAGPGSDPDTQNCGLVLSPSIWVNRGGWWGARTGVISERGSGAWRQSSVDPNMIIGSSVDDDSDQVFQLKDVPSPMTVNKTGTGTLFKAGNKMPDGPVRWQITQVNSSGSGNLSDDGDDD